MSNYPNMSYCMNENTLLALRQVIDAMQDEGVDFLRDMTQTERRAFYELVMACEDFVVDAEVLLNEYEQDSQTEEAQ